MSIKKMHEVRDVHAEEPYLYLDVDGELFRIPWAACSPRLARATRHERQHLQVAPSGYGIHWPEIDEDLAITPLLAQARRAAGVPAE